MSRSLLGERLRQLVGGLAIGWHTPRRLRARRVPSLEPLEGRALLANITASGVISSAAAGSNFNYTIQLSNSSTSSAAVGTFWYAWIAVPNEDFLAHSPVSVSPPAGWTDQVTNSGTTDGFGILFTANSPSAYVQPGSSLNFSFVSADAPASVNGNSPFYPGTPVGTSFVYPTGPFSDAGHQFVVTPASSPPPNTPLVTVSSVQDVLNKKHLVTQINVVFSGAVNTSEADSAAIYALVAAGKKGSFTARNAKAIRLRSAVYNAATNTVTLTTRKAFALRQAVRLTIDGIAPGGLEDSSGRLIDGNHDGQPGGNAVIVLSRGGVTIE
jgi:hypothetical protein